jgi:hypothetical protein
MDPRIVHLHGPSTEVRTAIARVIQHLDAKFGGKMAARTMPTVDYMLNEVKQGFLFIVRFHRVRAAIVACNSEYACPFDFAEAARVASLEHGESFDFGISETQIWANHYILCTKPQPGGFGLAMVPEFLEFFDSVDVPDGDFFINRRDCPWVRRDGKHCYSFAATCRNVQTARLSPVLSLYQGDAWHDLPLPEANTPPRPQGVRWNKKKEVALFRGALTGPTDLRVKLAELSLEHPEHVDAGITSNPNRIHMVNNVVRFPVVVDRALRRDPIPIENWGAYKYVLYAEGYSAALRMGTMLGMNSVIIKVSPATKLEDAADQLWFFPRMRGWRITEEFDGTEDHVEADLHDIVDVVCYLKNNDDVAKKMADNASKLFDEISAGVVRRRALLTSLQVASST